MAEFFDSVFTIKKLNRLITKRKDQKPINQNHEERKPNVDLYSKGGEYDNQRIYHKYNTKN